MSMQEKRRYTFFSAPQDVVSHRQVVQNSRIGQLQFDLSASLCSLEGKRSCKASLFFQVERLEAERCCRFWHFLHGVQVYLRAESKRYTSFHTSVVVVAQNFFCISTCQVKFSGGKVNFKQKVPHRSVTDVGIFVLVSKFTCLLQQIA